MLATSLKEQITVRGEKSSNVDHESEGAALPSLPLGRTDDTDRASFKGLFNRIRSRKADWLLVLRMLYTLFVLDLK